MTQRIDFSKAIPIVEMRGETERETSELQTLYEEAKHYLMSFPWCSEILESFFGLGIDKIVSVFLFKILPSSQGVDDWIWVIVGDLPPAYITTDSAPNPAAALDAYIGAMNEWVEALRLVGLWISGSS